MDKKIQFYASEILFDTKRLIGSELNKEIKKEIENFAERNSLLRYEDNSHECCLRCLKAHFLKLVKNEIISISDFMGINKKIKEDAGHHGYYLDDQKLIKI
ncbi:MAG: hypothetical protein AABW65_02625 [Nanoarchaeota archaeon]